MKISTAIQILLDKQLPLNSTADHDHWMALTLAIQSLQRVQLARLRSPNSILAPLPGESAEQEVA